ASSQFCLSLLSRSAAASRCFHEFDFFFRRGDALLRLLLKGVQHVNCLLEADRIDDAVGVPLVRCHDFKHSAAAEAFEGFDGRVFLAALSCIKSLSHFALYRPGESLKISSR